MAAPSTTALNQLHPETMGYVPCLTRQRLASVIVLMAGAALWGIPFKGLASSHGDATRIERSLTLLQESLLWIREEQQASDADHSPLSPSAFEPLPVESGLPMEAIPLSSAPARQAWVGEAFYLRGEDQPADQADRVRMGFESTPLPGFGNNLTVDGNWSVSQQPGDSTMDIGLAWQVPWGGNQLAFRGRLHEYENEAIAGDALKRFGGTRQTLEMDLTRSLYDGDHASLDARVITTDVTNQWYENGDLTGEARRSYSLVRLDGRVGSYLPWFDARGDLALAVEGCVALMDGTAQEACGEQLGAFQRYNLAADLKRQWLQLDWALHGEYQFTPDELPSWRYLEVGQGMMHGFGGQVMRGRQGGWLRVDSETPSRLLWLPLDVRTNLRFSVLRGWTETAGDPDLTSRTSVAEVLWRVRGDHLSAGLRAGTLLETKGPAVVAPDVPDISLDLSWTL